jgi:hypothetical protein
MEAEINAKYRHEQGLRGTVNVIAHWGWVNGVLHFILGRNLIELKTSRQQICPDVESSYKHLWSSQGESTTTVWC